MSIHGPRYIDFIFANGADVATVFEPEFDAFVVENVPVVAG